MYPQKWPYILLAGSLAPAALDAVAGVEMRRLRLSLLALVNVSQALD